MNVEVLPPRAFEKLSEQLMAFESRRSSDRIRVVCFVDTPTCINITGNKFEADRAREFVPKHGGAAAAAAAAAPMRSTSRIPPPPPPPVRRKRVLEEEMEEVEELEVEEVELSPTPPTSHCKPIMCI